MKTVTEMAREAGVYKDCAWRYEMKAEGDSLERFAALVIANHPPQSFMTYHEGVEAGRLAERERLQAFMRQMLDAYTLPSDPSGLKTRGTKE